MQKIKAVVSDIDGVLTDGKIYINPSDGHTYKILNFKDMDAVGMLKFAKILFCIITGEDDLFVDEVERRFNPDICIRNCKDKSIALKQISEQLNVPASSIVYIGDGKYDIAPIKNAGIGICPLDAIDEVKNISDYVLKTAGGAGCIASVYTYLMNNNG